MTESSGNRRGEGMVVQSQRFLTMEEFLGTFFSVLHGGSRKDGHTSRIFESLARDAETTRSLAWHADSIYYMRPVEVYSPFLPCVLL